MADIRALIFDFDGLILDTETPDFQSWQEIYRQHGLELPLSLWATFIGGPSGSFHPFDNLQDRLGRQLDRAQTLAQHKRREQELFAGQAALPGVLSYLDEAQGRGLHTAIASSSPSEWVMGHLGRIGLQDRFSPILTSDDVRNVKPDPELFLATLRAMDLSAAQAVVLEDSPNGVRAAKGAGLYCVAVANAVTRQLDLSQADLVLDSLEQIPLAALLARAAAGRA
jgi:HAD superfamily hydrolase (TIGR01509 family)